MSSPPQHRWHGARARLDAAVAESRVGKYFQLEQRRTNLTREVYAGCVTFLTMAYILAINASILSESGGPCSVADCTGPERGTDACKVHDPGYQACLDKLRQNLITATAASSIVSCFIMGAFANMPVALAPGLGLNAYFAYNVVGFHGSGSVSYGTALAAVFVEGWIFILLSVTGARAKLITYMPRSIALSMSAGIGMFLAFVGLQYEEGLGVSVADGATLVTLGGCPVSEWVNLYPIRNETDACITAPDGSHPNLTPSSNHICSGHKMSAAPLWLGLSGLAVMTVTMHRGWKGSVMIGILFVTIIAWIPGHGASYLGSASSYPGGIGGNGTGRLAYFKKVVAKPDLSLTGGTLDFHGLADGSAWLALITFLYVDFLDCTGTLFSMANFLNSFIPGFVNRKKQFPKSTWAFSADGAGIVVGSVMGSSPVTAYIESATGIKEGARTGIAALTCSFCFFVSLFFNPLIASIPPYATGPAIILVGALMMVNIVKIRWNNVNEAVPAFLTMIVMPMTYSIAYGVVAGLVAYIITNGLNRTLDWAGDKLWEWRHGEKKGPKMRHSGSIRGRRDPNSRDRTFRLHRGDSSAGGDSQKTVSLADPVMKSTTSFGGVSYAGSSQYDDGSHLGDESHLGDGSHLGDTRHIPDVLPLEKDAELPSTLPDKGIELGQPKVTDSVVELTGGPMQRPPAPASEIESASGSVHAQPLGSHSDIPELGRTSTPTLLTAGEVEALRSPFDRTSSKKIMTSGVDMYKSDPDLSDAASPGLGAPKKSVAETYDDLWSD